MSGDHQMTVVLLASLLVSSTVPDGHVVQYLCIWFIALQAVLAYCIAGWAKLTSPAWRSGEAVVGVMRTVAYGNRTVANMVQRWHMLAFVAAWVVIVFESGFFLVLAGVPEITWGLLATAMVFHGAVAVVMGLNLFFWAFVATYPSILFCTFGMAP